MRLCRARVVGGDRALPAGACVVRGGVVAPLPGASQCLGEWGEACAAMASSASQAARSAA